jgi:hypothetical protein
VASFPSCSRSAGGTASKSIASSRFPTFQTTMPSSTRQTQQNSRPSHARILSSSGPRDYGPIRLMPAAYFFGAGASKADHFPITRELLCALAAWLGPGRRSVRQGAELYAFLHSAFGVTFDELRMAADQWALHCRAVTGQALKIPAPPARLPHLTDILSILDILLADEGGFGLEADTSRALKGLSLRKAREQTATAIALGFNELHRRLRERRTAPLLVDRFLTRGVIGPGDVLVTTNWDIPARPGAGPDVRIDAGRLRHRGPARGHRAPHRRPEGPPPQAVQAPRLAQLAVLPALLRPPHRRRDRHGARRLQHPRQEQAQSMRDVPYAVRGRPRHTHFRQGLP